MASQIEAQQALLDRLLDVRVVFDPMSALTQTLEEAIEEALGSNYKRSAVSWVALPDLRGGLVVEHVLGHRTTELKDLAVPPGQGLTGRVYAESAIRWVEEYADAVSITHEFDRVIEAERLHRLIAAPLAIDGQTLGVLTLGRRDPGAFADRTVERVEQLAKGASFALAVAKEARDRARAAALAERRRISEEVHDGVGALLFSIAARTENMHSRAANQELASDICTLQNEVAEVSGIVRDLISGWHASASSDLRAEVEGQVDLFQQRTGLDAIAVFLGPPPELNSTQVEAISRFVAVTLANAERHAQATRVSVTVATVPDQVTTAVSNDGPSPRDIRPGIGLSGAAARLAAVGGELSVVAEEAGDGFTIRARVPR